MRVRTVELGLALLALSVSGMAQIDPHPQEVHRMANVPIADLSLSSVEFQDLKPGTQQIGRVKLASLGAARTVKFEAIEPGGKLIAPLPAIRSGHDPEDGEYMVLVDVSRQAFKIRATGVDVTGAAYERVYSKIFVPGAVKPTAGPDPKPAELLARFEAERKSHPDGVVNISPIDISYVGYEPLVVSGNLQGIRVWYTVHFATDGVYSLAARVFPVYEDVDSRGLVSMRVLRQKLEPTPEPASGGAKFRAGTEYRMVLEMIPDYIISNSLENKFCIYESKFPAQGKGRDAWNLVKSNPMPIRYGVDIPGLNYVGETDPFYSQRSFYESFLKQGAFDCGPTSNPKF